jgi:pyruvate-formate lyase-activating enzyme
LQRIELPEKFCILPFISARITYGAAVPCCVNHGEVFGLTQKTSASDIYKSTNAALMAFRRQCLQNQLPSSCSSCIAAESHGATSHRIFSNQRWGPLLEYINIDGEGDVSLTGLPKRKEQPIFFIDGAGGTNRCDLKCRMCHSYASSSNRVEEITHNIPAKIMNIDSWLENTVDDRTVEIKSFNHNDEWLALLKTNLPSLKEIHYDSGEPLINPDTYSTLAFLKSSMRTDVRLRFHSNVMKASAKGIKFADAISGFSDVVLNCSMDALRDKNHYIRYPSDHDTIFANLHEIKEKNPNVRLRLAITFQLLNSLCAADLIMFALNEGIFEHISLEYLNVPYAYSASSLPVELKRQVTTYWDHHKTNILSNGMPTWHFAELDHCLRMMNSIDSSDHIGTFAKETSQRDLIRRQNICEVFSEFTELYTQSLSSKT